MTAKLDELISADTSQEETANGHNEAATASGDTEAIIARSARSET
jgi:hypothetical protein